MDFQEVGWGDGLDQAGSGYGQVAGTCKCCNEPPDSIKCREFLGQLRTRQLLKNDCSTEWQAWCDKQQPDTATEGPHCWPKWEATVVMKKMPLRKKSETYSQPQKPLNYTPISFITQYSIKKNTTTRVEFHSWHKQTVSSPPCPDQVQNSPSTLTKKYRRLLSQQQILCSSNNL